MRADARQFLFAWQFLFFLYYFKGYLDSIFIRMRFNNFNDEPGEKAMNQTRRSKRIGSFIFILCVIGLFALEMRLPLSDSMHRSVEVLIALVSFGLYVLFEIATSQETAFNDQEESRELAHQAIGPLKAQPARESEAKKTLPARQRTAFHSMAGWLTSLFALLIGFLEQ